MAKAESFGIPNISEDELLDMILVKSEMEPKYVNNKDKVSSPTGDETKRDDDTNKQKDVSNKEISNSTKILEEKSKNAKENKHELNDKFAASSSPKKQKKSALTKTVTLHEEPVTLLEKEQPRKLTQSKDLEPIDKPTKVIDTENLPWTDKYRPNSSKSIIGQQGNDSPMNKLKYWLQNWYKSFQSKTKGPRGFADSYKCALLSGAPGVGKIDV